MKIGSFLSLILITGFLFMAVLRLHPVGEPVAGENVFTGIEKSESGSPFAVTMDDYFLRMGQKETGSNNIVTSVVFDYRGFDTLGEASVLFIVVSAVAMLLFSIVKGGGLNERRLIGEDGFPVHITRIVSIGALLLLPIIISFGAYLVIHGHLSPGGGFQGGAVMATGTALLIVSSYMTRNLQKVYGLFSFFESLGLTVFISLGFAGIGTSFLFNFLSNGDPAFLGRVIETGPNQGFLNSGGILPLLSLSVGLEVFCGISIILVYLNRALYNTNGKVEE